MKLSSGIISTTDDLHRLKERYQELRKDPDNTDTDIVVGMLVETALIVAPKGIGMYIKKLGELIMKGLGKSSKTATNIVDSFGIFIDKSADSEMTYQQNKD